MLNKNMLNKKAYKKDILAEFNFGKGKDFGTLIKEYPAYDLSYTKLRRWVWTPDFREKVLVSWFESNLTDEDLKLRFPNYELNRAVVLKWARRLKAKKSSSFEKTGGELSKKRVVISEDEFNYVVLLVLDPLRCNRLRDILSELENKYKKVFTRGALCIIARTALFRHRLLPWAFTYFFGLKDDYWVKAGTTDNYLLRVRGYETIIIDDMTVFLILSYPLKYQFTVDTWFKKSYKDWRVYKIHEGIPVNDYCKGEFYKSAIVDIFKNSPDHTITLEDKAGNFFQVTLEKIIPGSEKHKNVTRLLKLYAKLITWVNDAVDYELAPGIENHEDIIDYPDSFRNKKLHKNYKKLESVILVLEEANADLNEANASLKNEIVLLKKGSDGQKNKSEL